MKGNANDRAKAILANSYSHKDELHLDLWYPNLDDTVSSVVLGLVCVRAADDIRIGYDYDRDGWKIEQASKFEWSADDKECDPDWQEVAFIQAWGREEKK